MTKKKLPFRFFLARAHYHPVFDCWLYDKNDQWVAFLLLGSSPKNTDFWFTDHGMMYMFKVIWNNENLFRIIS